jgi:hypothetical protein
MEIQFGGFQSRKNRFSLNSVRKSAVMHKQLETLVQPQYFAATHPLRNTQIPLFFYSYVHTVHID